MFHPVGSQPPSVYWRRRLIVVGLVVLLLVLLVLTVRTVTSGGDKAAASPGSSTAPPTTPHASSTTPPPSTPAKTTTQHSSSKPVKSPSRSVVAAPSKCATSALTVTAVVAQPNYSVGAKPVVELQVTNSGAKPCVQDLADKQVVLKIYNGESRVWGSHDCEVQGGTDERTLAVGQPVRVSITWSGLTSQPGCSGTRQRVGAGTYTLYASLSGKTGKAAQFAIT